MRLYFLSILLFISFFIKAQINVSVQKGVKFSDYKTFAIQKGKVNSSIVEQKINENKVFTVLKESVTREMTARGYTLAADSIADLIVTYFLDEADRSNYEKAGPLGQTPKDEAVDVNEIDQTKISRTLILEIVGRRKKSSLWTATCQMGKSFRDVYGQIDETVLEAFQKFSKRKGRR